MQCSVEANDWKEFWAKPNCVSCLALISVFASVACSPVCFYGTFRSVCEYDSFVPIAVVAIAYKAYMIGANAQTGLVEWKTK